MSGSYDILHVTSQQAKEVSTSIIPILQIIKQWQKEKKKG